MATGNRKINELNLMAHGFTKLLNIGLVVVGDASTRTQNGRLTLENVHNHGILLSTYGGSVDDVSANPDLIFENEESEEICIDICYGSSFLCNSLAVQSSETVGVVKKKFLDFHRYSKLWEDNVNDIELQFNGTYLRNNRTLASCGVQRNSCLYLTRKVPGSGDPTFYLDESFLDTEYNFTYPDKGEHGENFRRGNEAFERPYGWRKIGLRVLGKYEDDIWLGEERDGETLQDSSADGEWPVSYHGTKRHCVDSMIINGYDLSKGEEFVHGVGIYSSPTPSTAELYAGEFDYEGDEYKMMFMNRVKMNCTQIYETPQGTYFVTPDDRAIRPYAILYKKIDKPLTLVRHTKTNAQTKSSCHLL